MQRGTVRHPFLVYFLTMITCGLYGIYWFFVTSEDINRGLGRREFNPFLDFVLMFVTCGLWWFWWTWRASEAIVEVQQLWGVKPKMDEALLFIIAFFGFGEIVKQMSLNNAWENGSPNQGRLGHEPPQGTTGNTEPGYSRPAHPPSDGSQSW